MFNQIINKYNFNKLVLLLAQSSLYFSFWLAINQKISWHWWPLLVLWNFASLHYHFNLVHLASHRMLSKNGKLNSFLGNLAAIFGGVTLADFQTTHSLHHRNPSDSQKDPDYKITQSNFFILPFKIWYHDIFFWSRGLWNKQRNWAGYLADRVVQILIISAFIFTENLQVWLWLWLLPVFLVGFFNGMFLFYFPHHTTALEKKWRLELMQSSNNSGIIPKTRFNFIKLILLLIDISRFYHETHHDKVLENTAYYPLEDYLIKKIRGKPIYFEADYHSKYTDIFKTIHA